MQASNNNPTPINRRINWKDGMVLTGPLFNEDRFLIESRYSEINRHLLIKEYGYGLLPPRNGSRLKVEVDNEDCIEIFNCYGITKTGGLIEVPYKKYIPTLGELHRRNNKYWLVVGLSDKDFNLVGKPAHEKEPVFPVYREPKYIFKLVPDQDWNPVDADNYFIPIAQLERDKMNRLKDLKRYIPPCSIFSASQKLLDFQEEIRTILKELSEGSYELIRNSTKQGSIANLFSKITAFLEQNTDYYLTICPNESPVYSYVFFQKFARTYFGTLQKLPPDNRIQFQEFIQRHTDLSAYKQNQYAKELINSSYQHQDVANLNGLIENFLYYLMNILKILKELNYRDAPKQANTEPFIINVELQNN